MKQPITAYGDNDLKSTLFIERIEGDNVFGRREVRDAASDGLLQESKGLIAYVEGNTYRWHAELKEPITGRMYDYSNFEAIVFNDNGRT
jgi:hypothetical protein